MGAPGILGKCDEIFRKAAERAAAETHRDIIPGLMVRFCDLAATEYRRSWDEHYLKLREMYIKEHLEHIEKNLAPLCRDLRTLLIKEEIMAPPDHPLDLVGKWAWITLRPKTYSQKDRGFMNRSERPQKKRAMAFTFIC